MNRKRRFLGITVMLSVSLLAIFFSVGSQLKVENPVESFHGSPPLISLEKQGDKKKDPSQEDVKEKEEEKENIEKKADEKKLEEKRDEKKKPGEKIKPKEDQGKKDKKDKPKKKQPGKEKPEPKQPWEADNFKDKPEDAFAQQTIHIENLLKELNLKDSSQILEVRCITGPKDSNPIVDLANGIYSLVLSTKRTTDVRIRYVDDEGNVQSYIKKINYVRPEGSTPKAKQPLIKSNLKDMAVYNHPELNFDVWVTDYRGKPLAYNNMEVTVNGKKAKYIGEMSRQTYNIRLKNGTNEIDIKITDEYQYTVTKKYTVYYKSGKGKVTISLEGGPIGIKYFISPQQIEVESGVPLSYVIDKFLKKNGYKYDYAGSLDEGFYLARVRKKNMIKGYKIPKKLQDLIRKDQLIFDKDNYDSLDSLGEFDFCQGSGWMYSINGLYSSYGFNKAYAQDGDRVRIRFTLAYGKDINGYEEMGQTYGKLKSYGQEW